MITRVILTVIALSLLSAPAAARKKLNKRNLKLWDRVLFKRYKRAQKLAEQAQQHASRGRYKQAVGLLKRALKVRPYAASLWFNLGTVYSYAGAYKPCVKALYKARKLDAKHKKNLTSFRLGLCLSMSGRIAQGVVEYKKVYASRWVTGAVLNWNMADNYMALGRIKEAITHYRTSLQRNPGQRVLHFALAVALDRAGRLRSADRQLKRAHRLDPTGKSLNDKDIIWLPHYDHLYYRALRAYSLGQKGAALSHWQKFLGAAPSSPWAYVVGQRVKRLRTAPFTAGSVEVDHGTVDKAALASALTAAQAKLRACLGQAPDAAPKIGALKALRISLKAGRRGVTTFRAKQTFGAAGAAPTACLKAALRKVRWTTVTKDKKPVGVSFSLVGP